VTRHPQCPTLPSSNLSDVPTTGVGNWKPGPLSIKELAATNGVNASYFTRVLRLAYLAPDVVEAIVTGRKPPNLLANRLVRMLDLPIDWSGQREYLGFPAA
jgi:hypothetical protein